MTIMRAFSLHKKSDLTSFDGDLTSSPGARRHHHRRDVMAEIPERIHEIVKRIDGEKIVAITGKLCQEGTGKEGRR
jgi:hypothetical protein